MFSDIIIKEWDRFFNADAGSVTDWREFYFFLFLFEWRRTYENPIYYVSIESSLNEHKV